MSPASRRKYKSLTLIEFVQGYSDRIELDRVTGCLNWTGPLVGGAQGRPQLKDNRRVARVVLEQFIGRELRPWPEEAALHSCDNGLCVNWWHLRPGTLSDNVQDMISRGRAAWSARVPESGVCGRCGKPTTVSRPPSSVGRPIYCSRNCAKVRVGIKQPHRPGAIAAAARGRHTRWHVRRGVVSVDCELCERS